MPCRSDGYGPTELEQLKVDHDKLTKDMCNMVRELDRRLLGHCVTVSVREWYVKHDQLDQKRKREERMRKIRDDEERKVEAFRKSLEAKRILEGDSDGD